MRTGRGASRVGGGARRPRRGGSACSCRVPAQSCRTLHAPRTAVHQASPYLELAQDRAEAWAQTQLQCEHAYNCIRALHGGCPLTGRKGTPALLTAHPGPVGSRTYPSIKTLQCCSGEPQLHIPSPPSPLPWTEQGAAHRRPWGSSITPSPRLPSPGRSGGLLTGGHGAPPSPPSPSPLPWTEWGAAHMSPWVSPITPVPPAVSPPLDRAGGCSAEAVGLLPFPLLSPLPWMEWGATQRRL